MRAAFGDASVALPALRDLDLVVLAVGHEAYRRRIGEIAREVLGPGGLFIDLSHSVGADGIPSGFGYGTL